MNTYEFAPLPTEMMERARAMVADLLGAQQRHRVRIVVSQIWLSLEDEETGTPILQIDVDESPWAIEEQQAIVRKAAL